MAEARRPTRAHAEWGTAVAAVARARGLRLPPRPMTSAFARWQARYRGDPLAFVHDCVAFGDGKGPTPYQDEALGELVARRRIAVRSPHGAGKTALASWVVLWAALTEDDCKVPTTASAWRQLSKFLWPELHKWAARVRWDERGGVPRPRFSKDELQTRALKRPPSCEAFAVASNQHELIEGAHAHRIVYVYDEAKAIPVATFDATEGAFAGAGADTGNEAFALAISTPGEPTGRFYDIHARKPGYHDWWVRHWTLDECVRAGQVSREWARQRALQWGEKSAVYQNRVLGEFASSEEDGVVPLSWIEAANERWREWEDAGFPVAPVTAIGVDVARSGEDQTVIAGAVENLRVLPLRKFQKEDTMATVGRVVGLLDASPGAVAVVDVIGIGAGVVDRLREQGREVLAHNASARTDRKDRSGELGFADVRSAGWWLLRERLEPGLGDPVALPPDDELTGELTAPKSRVMSGGKIRIESKEDVRKRIGRSTDCADAVIMALVGPELCREFTGAVSAVELPW